MFNRKQRTGISIMAIFFLISIGYGILGNIDIQVSIKNSIENPEMFINRVTDQMGRDLVSMVIVGSCLSIALALSVTLAALFIGTAVGITAAVKSTSTDYFLMRGGDVLLSFPGILLVMLFYSLFGSNFFSLAIIIAFYAWIPFARLVRIETKKILKKNYIVCAIGYNCNRSQLIKTHILPNLYKFLLTQSCITIANTIIIESTVGFLGISIDPELPALGKIINDSFACISSQPALFFIPSITLFLILHAINLIADGFMESTTESM